MTFGSIFRSAGNDFSQAVQRATSGIKPVFGTLVGGVAVSILGAGESAIDKLKAKANAQLANSRAQIAPKTRVGLVGLFGGVPASTLLIVGVLAVGAILLLRRK